MVAVEITFSNRAYGEKWFDDVRLSNPAQYAVIEAIIEAIELADGHEISQAEIFKRHPPVARYVQERRFKIVPSNGQLLIANGRGIRHAKYSPSKSVAVVWEKIRRTVYVTFDDHAPIPYHRAIWHLRDIRLGKPTLAKKARTGRRFLRKLEAFKLGQYLSDMRRFNPRSRFYR